MSVCVVCNISDGVVIGVDSATTIGDPSNPVKVYEDVPKLFRIGNLPIGLATYGLASIAGRTIASWASEFAIIQQAQFLTTGVALIEEVVEAARAFFWIQYSNHVLGPIAVEQGLQPDQVSEDILPVLGIVIGGFSSNAFYSEVWTINIPSNRDIGTAQCLMPQQHFGSAWFAMGDPITRYTKGIDTQAMFGLEAYVDQIRQPLTDAERLEFRQVAQGREYPIVFNGMPIAKGIKYVRFLVDLVIGHHMFAVGASVVGGCCRVGYVTYEKNAFTVVPNGEINA